MPKRLLRYALSRLELLDAEALDMDNLDLAIGRNTVLEFRDVGIKLNVGFGNHINSTEPLWLMSCRRNSTSCYSCPTRSSCEKQRSCFYESPSRWTFIQVL
jgi:hypothetical protein